MAAGLATYQWNNQIKSILLLMGFPLLLVLMVFAFFAAGDLWWQEHTDLQNINTAYNIIGEAARDNGQLPSLESRAPGETDTHHALRAGFYGVANYGVYAVGLALIWFAIAWQFHGSLMRMASHSKPVTRQQMPKIYNMLENLCISRGIAMPQFEIIDSPALNAFATGLSDSTYRIVLTRGLVETLPDDELEAVIGHELTHILNRDARLLVIAVIFVGMISFFAQMLSRMLYYGGRPNYYSRRDNDRGGGAILISMAIALLILMIGYMFAIVIRFALSRKREYLADAGSVDLTKNPEAMMKALLRISGNDTVTGMPNEVQQMCIENTHEFLGLFATHPPVKDRVAAISAMTNTPVPELGVNLRRPPKGPWESGAPPAAAPAVPPNTPPKGPWGPIGGGGISGDQGPI